MLVAGIGNGMADVTSEGLASANEAHGGNVQGIAYLLFTDYILAFEVTSALLITAALGAMVLAHRERWTPKPTQEELSRARFEPGSPLPEGPLPAPGVYARHNAVDTPALLPDGATAESSIPRPLQLRHDVRPVDRQAGVETTALSEGASVLAPEGHPVSGGADERDQP
jgi:NADH-quinone oxidoreductase subunit J